MYEEKGGAQMSKVLPVALVLTTAGTCAFLGGYGWGTTVNPGHENLPLITRFHHANGNWRLCTLDGSPQLTLDESGMRPSKIEFQLTSWQLPQANIITSKKFSPQERIGSLSPRVHIVGPAQHQLPLTLARVVTDWDDKLSAVVLRLDTGEIVLRIGQEKPRYDTITLVDPSTVVLFATETVPGTTLNYLLARWQEGQLSIRREGKLNLAIRQVLGCDMLNGQLRLFYYACASQQEAEAASAARSDLEKWKVVTGLGSVRVCTLDVDTGRVLQDRVLVEKISDPVLAFTQDGKELWLCHSHRLTCYSIDSLEVRRSVALEIKIPWQPNEQESLLVDWAPSLANGRWYATVDPTGRYLAFLVGLDGPIVVLDGNLGKIVLADRLHGLRVLKLFTESLKQGLAFPTPELLVQDLAFIDHGKTLVAVAGTGHLYFYDITQGKLARTVVVSEIGKGLFE